MKYVRNIEDLKKYTFEFFDSFLPQELSDKMVNYFLLNLGNKGELENSSSKFLENCSQVDEKAICEYGEVILQLNDYKDLLKKYIELLLRAKKFELLCEFLNRIFLQQIGDAKYKSTRKDYNIDERYFDRFIEITLYCEIEKELFTPFFLAIFNCDSSSKMFAFKEPLKEYLDIFLKKGDDENFISALLDNDKKSGLNEYANKSTIKTLSVLIDGFVSGEITNSNLVKTAISTHKMEAFNLIEALLQNEDKDVKFKAVQLLLLLGEDRRVKDRLKFIYENCEDSKIKSLLEKECNFNSLIKFETSEEFFDFVDKATPQIQERLYGARLTRYYKKENLDNTGISGKTLTFIMDTFRNRESDVQLIYLKDFFRFVDEDILHKISRVVYEVAIYRDRLLSSKWALRLIALFGDKDLILSMTSVMEKWFSNTKTIVTAKYFLELLTECGREEFIAICRALLETKLDNKQKKFLENKMSDLSKTSNQNLEEVKDKLSGDLGFDCNGIRLFEVPKRTLKAIIGVDCKISLVNQKTNKPARIKDDILYEGISLKKYLKGLEKEIKIQKKRLQSVFFEFRNYTLKTFKECILDNPLLNFLSQNLVWARYKKGKLAEVCALHNNKLLHLSGNLIMDNFDDYTIALAQPLDCQDQKERIKEKFGKTLFNQFDYPIFKVEDYNQSATSVDTLSGIFCTAKLFITRLEKMKFKINDLDNKNEYSMLIKENKNLNLLTAVEFDKVLLNHEDTSITISKVRFYDLNKQARNGKTFNLDRTEAKSLSDMEPHVFSNELSQIFLACKN